MIHLYESISVFGNKIKRSNREVVQKDSGELRTEIMGGKAEKEIAVQFPCQAKFCVAAKLGMEGEKKQRKDRLGGVFEDKQERRRP